MLKTTLAMIEDNPDNRLLIRALLEERYLIQEYEDGVKALEAMPLNLPDVLLMDISLPILSGVEVLQKMRQHPDLKNIPVIALTAHAMSGDREKYLSYGFDAYLAKPIWDDQVLCQAIESVLKKS